MRFYSLFELPERSSLKVTMSNLHFCYTLSSFHQLFHTCLQVLTMVYRLHCRSIPALLLGNLSPTVSRVLLDKPTARSHTLETPRNVFAFYGFRAFHWSKPLSQMNLIHIIPTAIRCFNIILSFPPMNLNHFHVGCHTIYLNIK